MKSYMDLRIWKSIRKLCQLHIEICDLSHTWPSEEKKSVLPISSTARQHNSSANIEERHGRLAE